MYNWYPGTQPICENNLLTEQNLLLCYFCLIFYLVYNRLSLSFKTSFVHEWLNYMEEWWETVNPKKSFKSTLFMNA